MKDPEFFYSDSYLDKNQICYFWKCKKCNSYASLVRDTKYQCHNCSDWSPCGKDCDVVFIVCTECFNIEKVLNR